MQRLKTWLHSLWLAALKRYGIWYRKRRLWFSQRHLEVMEAIRPGGGELMKRDTDQLAGLVESQFWPAVVKYLELERQASRDNGLILANDLMSVGEVKGDIGRCNKIQTDFIQCWEETQAQGKVTTEKTALDVEQEEEQDEGLTP